MSQTSKIGLWESKLAARGTRRPFIFDVNYAFWAILNISSWIGADAVLLNAQRPVWASLLAVVFILVGGPLVAHHVTRGKLVQELQDYFESGLGTGFEYTNQTKGNLGALSLTLTGSVAMVSYVAWATQTNETFGPLNQASAIVGFTLVTGSLSVWRLIEADRRQRR